VNNQLKSLVADVRLFRRAKEMRFLATFAFIGVAAVSLFFMPSCGKDSKSRGGNPPANDQGPGNGDTERNPSGKMFLTWPQNAPTYHKLAGNAVYSLLKTSDTLFAGTNLGLSISKDGGTTWISKTTSNGLGRLDVTDLIAHGTKLYACSGFGLSISEDNGSTWTFLKNTAAENRLVRQVALTSNSIFLSTTSGLLVSKDAGLSWQLALIGPQPYDSSIRSLVTVDSEVYVGTENSGLFVSKDGGVSFQQTTKENGLISNLVRTTYVSGQSIYIGHEEGVSISHDSGQTWAKFGPENGISGSINDIIVVDSVIYAGTSNGLFISKSKGTKWVKRAKVDGLGDNIVHKVLFWNQRLLAGTEQGLSSSEDGGLTWENQSSSDQPNFNRLVSVLGNKVKIVSNEKLWSSSDAGLSWRISELPKDNASSISHYLEIEGHNYALNSSHYSGGENKLYLSTDEGNSWNLISKSKSKAVDFTAFDSTIHLLMDATRPNSTVTYNELLTSHDFGKTWAIKEYPSKGISNYFDFRKLYVSASKFYTIGIKHGYDEVTKYSEEKIELRASDDMGKTWVPKDMPQDTDNYLRTEYIKLFVSDQVLYLLTVNRVLGNQLHKSTDGGDTWTNLNLPKPPKLEDCKDLLMEGKSAFVGCDSGLLISKDAGETWTRMTTADGLPSNKVIKVFIHDSKIFVLTDKGFAVEFKSH